MRVTQVRCSPFRIPLRRPFVTASAVLSAREGLIVTVETDEGIAGLGESSPLAGFGGKPLDETAREIATAARRLTGLTPDAALHVLQDMLTDTRLSGPAACGLDIALHDLRAKELGVPLSRLLGVQPAAAVPVNATLSAESPAELVGAAVAAVAQGFTTLKIKVAAAAQDDMIRVQAVRQAVGRDVRIRIDANGGWSVAEAVSILHRLAPLDIELVEQPVAAHDLAGLAQVRQETPVPVAADEAVADRWSLLQIIETGAADLVVLKPMALGGLAAARQAATLATKAGIGIIVTTTIDAGVGVAAALHLAAALGQGDRAHGLATASLLVTTLVTSLPEPYQGLMAVPQRPGLGVALDGQAIAAYGTGIIAEMRPFIG